MASFNERMPSYASLKTRQVPDSIEQSFHLGSTCTAARRPERVLLPWESAEAVSRAAIEECQGRLCSTPMCHDTVCDQI